MRYQARTIYSKLGCGDERRGRNRVRELTNLSDKTLRCWTYEKGRSGGTGGLIPAEWQQVIFEYFREELEPSHFFQPEVGDGPSRKAG